MRPLLAPLALVLALLAAPAAGAAVLEGTARAERLVGTARADVIVARGGADRVLAGAGDDRVAVQYDGARDTVSCGRGRDVVNADGADVVAADCEVVGRRISTDVHRNLDSQHETQVEPDSFTFGRTTVAAFQTGRRHAGAAANIAWATSTDDGRTWRRGELPGVTRNAPRPGTADAASDPVVAYSALHRTWLVTTLALGSPVRLTISRSPNGLSWSEPIDAVSAMPAGGGSPLDKQWLACDNGTSSPFRGRCYLVYNDFLRRAMAVVSSVDGGLTWSQPAVLPFAPFYLGPFPVVQPDGTLVLLVRVGTDDRYLGAVRSRDGGATLEPPVRIAPVQARGIGLRAPEIPGAAVDASGRIWVTWHSCARLPACTRNEILVASSADGVTWRPAVAVEGRGENGTLPTLAVAPGGRTTVFYYARAGRTIEARVVQSRDGASWSRSSQRLDAVAMPIGWLPTTTAGPMLADYVSVTTTRDGRALAVWALASEPAGGRLRQAIFATRLP